MVAKGKAKKKTGSRKAGARAKAAKPSAKRASAPRGDGTGAGDDESTQALRASAKAFAARLLR
jgi:hypothetical protein